MAEALKVPLYHVVLLNLVYEFATSCTSIIIGTPQGPLHGRTLDWPMLDLYPLTIDVDFVREGKCAFTATTFPGFVGILTATKPSCFSISVNFRSEDKEDNWGLIKAHLTSVVKEEDDGSGKDGVWWDCWPVSFLVRHVLEDNDATYKSAKARLESCPLIRPVYFTLAGLCHDEGVVITRDPHKMVLPNWELGQHGTIVQVGKEISVKGW